MAHIALERTKIGRPSKSLLMVGLRGVGKTVLLDRIREDAEETGISTLRIEAPRGVLFRPSWRLNCALRC